MSITAARDGLRAKAAAGYEWAARDVPHWLQTSPWSFIDISHRSIIISAGPARDARERVNAKNNNKS